MAAAALAQENIWFNKAQCEDAEKLYFEKLSGAKVKLNSACFLFSFSLIRNYVTNRLLGSLSQGGRGHWNINSFQSLKRTELIR